ncbi:hypothetical protein [Gordonia alkaliphila]|uniref:DUF559 domain-containing protein n=1 Tax=Gordonia alkaliphila TaxID=1053547 RepID=A0ABP8YX72_9ACTN
MGDAHRATQFLTVGEGGAGHGVYHRGEFADLDIDPRERRRMLRRGDLTSPRKDWFAVRGHAPAVAAAVAEGGVLSCVSALQRYGFWVPPGYPEQHVRSGRWSTHATTSCRGFSAIPAAVTAVDSIAVALECAAHCMTAEDWIAVSDSVQNQLGLSAEALRSEMGPLPQYVQALFDKTDGRSQSGTESITRVRLRALGFHVVVQPQVTDLARADLRIGQLIIECDSRQYHTDAVAYQNDRTRDRKSTVGGWLTFRLTWDDILYGWDEVIQDIRAITRAGRHRPGKTTAS